MVYIPSLSDIMDVWDNQFPPKPQWTTDQIPDLTDKVKFPSTVDADNQVVCVTGGYGGIGYETTKAILVTNPMLMIGFAITQCHSLHCGEVSGKS